MYFWTIDVRMGGTYTVKADTFGEACRKVGVDFSRARVVRVENA
jgi:hypothetical protein